MVVKTFRLAAVIAVVAGLAGCSLNESPDVGAVSGPSASASERTHQDIRVAANVMRADLDGLSSYGSACESSLKLTDTCLAAVRQAQRDVAQALADLQVLRIPTSIKTDVQALTAALNRTASACPPLLNAQADRIAEAYAANEFDTSVGHVLTALSKIESDGQ